MERIMAAVGELRLDLGPHRSLSWYTERMIVHSTEVTVRHPPTPHSWQPQHSQRVSLPQTSDALSKLLRDTERQVSPDVDLRLRLLHQLVAVFVWKPPKFFKSLEHTLSGAFTE